jgi:hypothetical protein
MTAMFPDTTRATAHAQMHAAVEASVDVYVNLSRAYAARNEARLAVLAQWVADVQVLQSLMWDSGLGSAPDPDAQLAAVAGAVDVSLREYATTAAGPVDLLGAVQGARVALTAAFDASVHDLLNERFTSLDHLVGLAAPAATAGQAARQARLGDRTVQELAGDLRVAAADSMAVSEALARAGHNPDALRQARLADLASFEAFLLEAADAVGDTHLSTVDLRWDLATVAVDDIDLPAEELSATVDSLRDALRGVVGATEADALSAMFEPVRMGTA